MLLEATVRVQDGSRPETMAAGFAELSAMQTRLRGILDLQAGDRLALDTRVR